MAQSEPIVHFAEAELYLDDIAHPLAGPVNVEKLTQALEDAMRDGTTLDVRIYTEDAKVVTAVLRPANARIAFIHPGPFVVSRVPRGGKLHP